MRSRDAAFASTTGPGVSSGGSSGTFDGDQSVSSSYAYALTNGSYNLHAFMGSITDSGTYSESNSSSYSSSSHSVGGTSSSSGAGAVGFSLASTDSGGDSSSNANSYAATGHYHANASSYSCCASGWNRRLATGSLPSPSLHFLPRRPNHLSGPQLGRPPADHVTPGFVERRPVGRLE